ncbi:MAG: flagellar M-ring protein FliF, partial [Actinobacteria bacterium]|nr:flagellar M-ring protein FliF [Actinomycetota bacterium]
MNESASKLLSRLQEVWKGLNLRQRITIIGTALFVLIALGVVTSSVARKPDYAPLYPKLDPQDAQEIATKLTAKKIPFKPSDDGSTILVPAKSLYSARWSLASEGLPKGGSTGYELFDKSKIGSTDFERRVNYVRALQGELERTFRQIDDVEQAKVLIVLPEESLFVSQQKPATASVLLKIRNGARLDGKQVRGIVQLVSHSVEGLKPEAVTVVDTHGRILSAEQEEAKEQTPDRSTANRMEIQKNFQRDLEKSVQSLLEQVLGPNNVGVRVTAELNFDDKTIENRFFQPVADGQGIVRSMQQLEKTAKGTEAPPPQPPGTGANIPGYTGISQIGGTSESSERSVTKNFEI